MAAEPNGCRHCGAAQRFHCQRWTDAAGWHTWTEPTDEQRKARMLARRNMRLAARSEPTAMTTEQTVYVVRQDFEASAVFATEDLARDHCLTVARAKAQQKLDRYGWLPIGERVPDEPKWKSDDHHSWPLGADGVTSTFGVSYYPLPVRTAAAIPTS